MSETKSSTTKNLFIFVIVVAVIAGIYVLKMNEVNNLFGIGTPTPTAMTTAPASKGAADSNLVPGGPAPATASAMAGTPATAPGSTAEPAPPAANTPAPAPASPAAAPAAPAQTPPAVPAPAQPVTKKTPGKKTAG